MNMNKLGKTLVLINVAFSVIALAFAIGVYTQEIDWGWKEPRKDLDGKRVAAEIVKRLVAHEEGLRSLTLVEPALSTASTALVAAEDRFWRNHLFYEYEIWRLRHDAKPIEVKEVKLANGLPVLDTPGKKIGAPVLEAPVPAIAKSQDAYMADLKRLHKEIEVVAQQIAGWIEKENDVTLKLDGVQDDKGRKIRPGLFDLIENEAQQQRQIKFERNYWQAIVLRTMEEAESFLDRRQRLESTLQRIKEQTGQGK